jgi:hypothetical protein
VASTEGRSTDEDNGSRAVWRGRETDLGRGGGEELRAERIACLGDDFSRFLSLGGEPRASR